MPTQNNIIPIPHNSETKITDRPEHKHSFKMIQNDIIREDGNAVSHYCNVTQI